MMKNTRKVLLAGSTAIAFGLVAGSAFAQTVPSANPDGGVYIEGAFSPDATPATVTNTTPTPVPGGVAYDSTAVQTGNTAFIDVANTDVVGGVTVNADVSGTYNTSQTTVTHVDTGTPANTTTDPSTYSNSLNGNLSTFNVSGSNSTGTPISSTNISTVPGTISGNTVSVTQTDASIGASGISYATYSGTATYNIDPNNGTNNDVTVTFNPTPVSGTTLNASGLTTTGDVNAANVTATGDVSANQVLTNTILGNPSLHLGTTTGASYVDVNANDVTIHGGNASTTVVVSNAGVQISDTTNGNTLLIDNTGAIINNGTQHGGAVYVGDDFTVSGAAALNNGVTVTGLTTTDALQVNGASNFAGAVTSNGITNTGQVETDTLLVNGTTTTNGITNTGQVTTDTLQVNGASNFSGLVTSNGINNTGQVKTDTLLVNGLSTTNGITNTGPLTNNGALNQTGAVNLIGSTSTLTVAGNTTLNGATNQIGTSTSNNTITGATTTINGGTANVNAAQNNIGTAAGSNTTIGNSTGALVVNAATTTLNGAVTVTNNLTTNGISNTGLISTGTLTTSGLATLNSASVTNGLTVGGLTTTNGISNTGNIANSGNYTTTTGNITTTSGQIAAGTIRINPSNNNTISGLANAALNATSTEAVTGQQLFATNQTVAAHYAQLMNRADKAYQGVAMGFAMNAAPLNLANGEGGISAGIGYFQGEWGGAVKAQYVTDSGVGLGLNVGFSSDAVGGGVGASIKF